MIQKYGLFITAVIVNCVASAWATDVSSVVDVSGDFSARDMASGVYFDGGFTVANSQLHTWANGYMSSGGYCVTDLATGTTTALGKPKFPFASNGYGDAFGLYDAASNVFYAGTYSDSGSGMLKYNVATSTWSSLGTFESLYGADVYNGDVYASGLNEIWNGSVGQNNQIALYDLTGAGSHDVLIQTEGNSASVAVDAHGNVYYADYNGTESRLYRWTKAQIDGVRADQGRGQSGGGSGDIYLTYTDAQMLCSLSGGGNGITVDTAGNVFVSVNSSSANSVQMWNASLGNTALTIATLDPSQYFGWFGALDSTGNVLNGGSLYMANFGSGGLTEITCVPEPTTLAAIAFSAMCCAMRRRRV